MQITNQGTESDIYLPMFSWDTGNPTEDANWWTKFFTVDLRPQGIYNGIDDGSQTWWWGPVEPGQTKEYAVKVFVPTDDPYAFDNATISVTSYNDDSVVQWFNITTRVSMPPTFYDDFETGVFGQYNDSEPLGVVNGVWQRDSLDVGIDNTGGYSPTHSMYVSGGETATTCKINMDIPHGIASCVIRRGGGISDQPELGDDLIVEYSDGNLQWAEWHELENFYGAGMPGEVFTPYWILPDDALNPRFQLRFRQANGEPFADYWHIDDVYIGPPESEFGMLSDNFQIAGPGATASYPIDVTNLARHADGYTVSIEGNYWPTWFVNKYDNFDDGDMNGWTVVDEGTNSPPSNWWVDNGKLVQDSNIHSFDGQAWSGTYVLNGDDRRTDYTIYSEIYNSDDDGVGLMGRYTDQNNYYRFHWTRQGWDKDTFKPGIQYRVLDKCVNGVWTVLASDDVPGIEDAWYNAEMSFSGNNIQVHINGDLIFDVVDDSHSQGMAGLYNWGSQNTYFDEVAVYNPDGIYSPIGPSGPLDTGSFQVLVQVPADAAFETTDTATLTVTSLADPTVSETITLITEVGRVHNLDRDIWYKDIQPAVDDANPGDRLYALSGEYYEHVVVEKPLSIEGQDTETTIVDGQHNGTPFTVRSDNVEITGFTIQNSGGIGDFNFTPGNAGIKLDGTANCLVYFNKFVNCENGVLSMFGGDNVILVNEFSQDFIGYYSMNHVEDDFSADSDLWTYEGDASLQPGYMELTPSANGQAGRALFLDGTDITSRFTAEFEYQIGDLNGGGADGLVFMFYKDTDYPQVGGNSLNFGTTTGYGIELDHYSLETDPSAEHIALIKDSSTTHLDSSNQNIDNNAWNRVRVVVDTDTITVYHVDMGTPIFSWTGDIDRTFGGMGFSASTGGARAHHRVRDFSITPLPTTPVGDLVGLNAFTDSFIGAATFFGNNNQITNNMFSHSFVGCAMGLEGTETSTVQSQGNMMDHNDFIYVDGITGIQAIDFDPTGTLNQWDDGSEGNYWSDYEDRYPGASEGAPGIWDTPYTIPFASQDNFPLMDRYTPLALPTSVTPTTFSGDAATQFTATVEALVTPQVNEVEDEPVVQASGSGGGGSSSTQNAPAPPSEPIVEPEAEPEAEPQVDEPAPEETVAHEPAITEQVDDAVEGTEPVVDTRVVAEPNSSTGFPLWTVFVTLALLGAAVYIIRKRH